MRKDMHKLIVERPRRGARFKLKRVPGEDPERLPLRLGPARHRALNGTRSKAFDDHLAPLERFLAKQLGRPWRKVHQEICAHVDVRHALKRHLMGHVEQLVQTRAGIGRDGALLGDDGAFCRILPWHQRYYVDPRDGILKASAKLWRKRGLDSIPWKRRLRPRDPVVRRLSDERELHLIQGHWYELRFTARSDAGPEARVFDLLRRTSVPARERHAHAKRQLSRQELTAHGLRNAP